ncbi:hypothetical protein, partial [Aeromicrobium sp. Leaf272]
MSIDLRRAESVRGGVYAAVLVALVVLLAALATLVVTDASQDLDGEVAQAAFDISYSRPWLVDVLE